jgi:hypothetical protein
VIGRGANLPFGLDKPQSEAFFASFSSKITSNSHKAHAGFATLFLPSLVHPAMSRVDALRKPV